MQQSQRVGATQGTVTVERMEELACIVRLPVSHWVERKERHGVFLKMPRAGRNQVQV